jgi:hypothetical protein
MANRVSAADVKVIIKTTLADADITKFITDANVFINVYLLNKINDNELLAEIEKYTAAHFIAITIERQTTTEKIGELTLQFNDINEIGLKSTTYGQMACNLDYTGTLDGLDNRKGNFKFIVT